MGENLSKWVRDVMYVLIPGIIYLIDIILLLQLKFDFDFISILKDYDDYSFFFISIIILISYVVGYAIGRAISVIHCLFNCNKSRKKFEDQNKLFINSNEDSVKKQKEISLKYYTQLILIRNLFLSVLFLFLIICFPEIFKCLTLLIFIVILLAFLAAWILLKIQVKIINDINSNEGNE